MNLDWLLARLAQQSTTVDPAALSTMTLTQVRRLFGKKAPDAPPPRADEPEQVMDYAGLLKRVALARGLDGDEAEAYVRERLAAVK